MYQGLVACRAGMGSSVLLKIKIDQVIQENNFPIKTEHGNLDSLMGYKGDVLFTMEDLAEELEGQVKHIVGIRNIVDKVEITEKIEKFLKAIEKGE